jgi:hypothetical protein
VVGIGGVGGSSGSLLDLDPAFFFPPQAPLGNTGTSGGASGGANEEQLLEFSAEVLIRISNDNIGRLIGKEGCIIRRIRHESQCRIEIDNCPPTRDFAMRVVRVRGHIAQTHVATAMILRQMLGTNGGADAQGEASGGGGGGGVVDVGGLGFGLGMGPAAPVM